MKRRATIILGVCLVFSVRLLSAGEAVTLFSKDAVIPIEVRIEEDGVEALRKEPREYARGRIRLGTNAFAETDVRLKGNATFRPIGQKPSFSLRLSPAAQKEFGGHKELRLNNSLQDRSLMRAKLASEMFLKAGVPTARVNFAAVTLNARPLGLYLLVEGIDEAFLRTHFGSADGNLYEGANQDIDSRLEIDWTSDGTDRSDLQALVQACTAPDWNKLSRNLYVNRFASFMAMELLVGHKDGYCMDLNNFRLYYEARSGKFTFIGHGLDFILDNPVLKQDRGWSGATARAFLETPEGRQMFKQRINDLGRLFYGDRELLSKRVNELWNIVGPSIADAREKERVLAAVRELQRVLRARAASFPRYAATLEGKWPD